VLVLTSGLAAAAVWVSRRTLPVDHRS
jgi:hypothetical protein